MSKSTVENKLFLSSQKKSTSLNRAEFEKEVYMTAEEAVHELHKRRKDTALDQKLSKYFGKINIPKELSEKEGVVLFRQVASCNYESSRFLIISDSLNLNPIFFEFYEDKFVAINELKKYLIKMPFHFGFGKNNHSIIEYKNITDANNSNGKSFNQLKTYWEESLIDFHHKVLKKKYPHIDERNFFDASKWLHTSGKTADKYYRYFLALFLKNTILLENFMLENESEKKFIETIFLPSLRFVREYFGVKPLIVALEPTDIEGNIFWHSYSPDILGLVKSKIPQ